MHRNSTRKGLGVRACTASSPHIIKKSSFHKLIRVIRIFMLKIFVVQCHPRNIFNIELFPNYGIFEETYVLLELPFHTELNGLCLNSIY